ncbi:nuclease PIN [Rouxiella silvae]|uniref:Nuclease PIN n=1 Tax=Rouxiella silvae TaxID=1646373 RepID=A0AA40X2T2_9GAMM|nr:pirin family protein [Rouxiella silvae]KQN52157.1 nuclease PIN [Serratia sp. Leaf50]MBF6637264.1 pirin family protein [Rouxiella silvae]ORJ18907.1 nuclease PIN [Rouxiella silvae]
MTRQIKQQVKAYRDDIRDLQTRRPLPGPQLEHLDPFLFLNHHGPQVYAPDNLGLPFGPHPHRGFETVTFIVRGELSHKDTGGHESIIGAGGVQWMTAGSGLIHSELSPESFKKQGGELEILQLWVNLPARLKMTAPSYVGLQAAEIPQIPLSHGEGSVSLISGEVAGVSGPINTLTDVTMMTVQLAAGSEITLSAPAAREVFLYTVKGRLQIGDDEAQAWHLIELDDAGDSVTVTAVDDAVILFGHADKIREPIVSHGPFVMNSMQEINQAILDYQAGKFDVKLDDH